MGHHGSDTSTTQPLVDAGDCTYAVWSAGGDNLYGHPHDGPVRRLLDAEVEVYGTATHGTVVLTADRDGWRVATGTGAPPGDGDDGGGDDGAPPDGCEPVQIDVNIADHESLQEIVHIGGDRAGQIIDLRRQEPFADLDDLERVDGLGPSRLQDIRDQGLACIGTADA